MAENFTPRFNYLITQDLIDYGFTANKDESPMVQVALNYSQERVNSLSGNIIYEIGYTNLSDIQKQAVKTATIRYAIWLIQNGQTWLRGSVSISTGGVSVSQSAPTEPDYIIKEVYNQLQQAGLFVPRAYINSSTTNNEFLNGENIAEKTKYDSAFWSPSSYWLSADVIKQTFLTQQYGITSKDGSVIISKYLNNNFPSIDLSSSGGSGKPKLDETYFKYDTNNQITISDAFKLRLDEIGNALKIVSKTIKIN